MKVPNTRNAGYVSSMWLKRSAKVARDSSRDVRISVLRSELVRLESNARERTRNVTTKASFLAVSAGVIISGLLTAELVVELWVKVAAFSLAVLALALASLSMAPDSIRLVSAKEIVDDMLEDPITGAELERRLTLVYLGAIHSRDPVTNRKAQLVSGGYFSLVVASLLLIAAFTADQISRGGA